MLECSNVGMFECLNGTPNSSALTFTTNCYFLTWLTRFTRLLLARYENENLMRKILKGNGEWGECTRERVNVWMLECWNVRMFEWGFRRFRRFRMFRLETTWTTGKNNLYLVRGRGALRLLRSSRFALTQPDRAPSCDFRYAKAPHYVRRGTWPLRGRCISRQAHLHARVFRCWYNCLSVIENVWFLKMIAKMLSKRKRK